MTPTRNAPKQEYIDAIKFDLEWLGLTWDRVEQQSKRLDRYQDAAEKLRVDGRFYDVVLKRRPSWT